MSESTAIPDSDLRVIGTRLAELTDLFRRRLVDDREKRRIIDDLADRLRAAEAGPYRQYLHPMVTGLALVVDRLDAYAGPDPEFVASVRDEVLDVLERHGVVTVDAAGPVDLSRHEVIEVQDLPGTGSPVSPDAMEVRHVVRRGFRHQDWTFRPARVSAAADHGNR